MKKKSFLTVAFLIYVVTVFSQQLSGGQEIISPEIHSDNKVTFRLYAPQSVKVEVTGDFLPPQKMETPNGLIDIPGIAELTKKENDVWEYTTSEPLDSELYSYTLIIDGVRVNDPNNVYLIRNVGSIYSIFIIGGGNADLYKVHNVPHGTVARRWYESPTLGKTRRITIYTPPDYELNNEKYPVLYLLHGAGGDEEAWINYGRTAQILDNLIYQGKAKPMIVVMTNGNSVQTAAPGESERGMYKPSFWGETRMDGNFEEAFPDVIKFIESNYRTVNSKSSRAIAGLSMGGFHSLHTSKEYPDKFDYVGLFSAAIFPFQEVKSKIYDNFEEKLKIQFSKSPKLYWVAIGDTDFLYQANVDFRKILDTNKFPYIYHETEGGHIWKNWRLYLTEFLQMLF